MKHFSRLFLLFISLLMFFGCSTKVTISGKITEDGVGVPSTSVSAIRGGESFDTITDSNGNYSFSFTIKEGGIECLVFPPDCYDGPLSWSIYPNPQGDYYAEPRMKEVNADDGVIVTIMNPYHIEIRNVDFYIFTPQPPVWGGSYDIADASDMQILLQYSEIVGNLTIHGSTIQSLSELEGLISIGGTLDFNNLDNLQSLDGLNNLTSVGGSLNIGYNDALTNINGLGNLTSVGESLLIRDNDALANIDALSNLTSVGGSLIIGDNDVLLSLAALNNLTSVSGSVEIWRNHALLSLEGLNNITAVGKGLDIDSNHALANIDALSNLTSVGRSLELRFNTALTDIDGLSNLKSVGQSLFIHGNDALTNIDALSNLATIDESMFIVGNDTLTDIEGLSNLISVGVSLNIEYNNAMLTLGLDNLCSVGAHRDFDCENYCDSFKIRSNSALCTSLAEALREQVETCNGITGDIDISSNKDCSAP